MQVNLPGKARLGSERLLDSPHEVAKGVVDDFVDGLKVGQVVGVDLAVEELLDGRVDLRAPLCRLACLVLGVGLDSLDERLLALSFGPWQGQSGQHHLIELPSL